MEENFSLQGLYDLMHRTLRATEETKKTLQMECDEAKYALKPWPIETTVTRRVDLSNCTCEDGMNTEARAEEIAAEIGKTLLQSQQLREKLAANLHKERQNARKPDVREIYTSALALKPKTKPLREANSTAVEKNVKNERQRRSVSQQRPSSTESRRSSGSQGSKARSASTARAKDYADENVSRRKPTSNQHLIRTSKDNVLAQMTGYHKPKIQTNFILANKLSVKSAKSTENLKQVSKSQVDLRRIGSSHNPPSKTNSKPAMIEKSTSPIEKNDEVENLSELDRLIKKFAAEATIISKDCPVHAENAPGVIEEKFVTSVDAVEGLDRFGLPSRLLKVLKIYHSYLRTEMSDEKPVMKKQKEACDSFLANFDRVSEKKKQSQMNKYQDLLMDYSTLFSESFKPGLKHHDIKILKSKFISLEPNYNECNIKSTAKEMTFVRSHSNESSNDLAFDISNWISNGIWNYSCIPNFKGIFGTHSTRYSDRNQLMLFHNLIQKAQRKVYETELMEQLLKSVIPKMKEFFDPSSKEFIDIYKMIVCVIQTINPKVPVLAKTDDN